MSSAEVLGIVASLDGGFNGEVINKEIGVEIVSDTEAIYTLRHWVDGEPTDIVEQYRLTLVEEEYTTPPAPEEA